jgi:hypothetical protein
MFWCCVCRGRQAPPRDGLGRVPRQRGWDVDAGVGAEYEGEAGAAVRVAAGGACGAGGTARGLEGGLERRARQRSGQPSARNAPNVYVRLSRDRVRSRNSPTGARARPSQDEHGRGKWRQILRQSIYSDYVSFCAVVYVSIFVINRPMPKPLNAAAILPNCDIWVVHLFQFYCRMCRGGEGYSVSVALNFDHLDRRINHPVQE